MKRFFSIVCCCTIIHLEFVKSADIQKQNLSTYKGIRIRSPCAIFQEPPAIKRLEPIIVECKDIDLSDSNSQ